MLKGQMDIFQQTMANSGFALYFGSTLPFSTAVGCPASLADALNIRRSKLTATPERVTLRWCYLMTEFVHFTWGFSFSHI